MELLTPLAEISQPTYAKIILSVMGNLILTPVSVSHLLMWASAVLYEDQVFFDNDWFAAVTIAYRKQKLCLSEETNFKTVVEQIIFP